MLISSQETFSNLLKKLKDINFIFVAINESTDLRGIFESLCNTRKTKTLIESYIAWIKLPWVKELIHNTIHQYNNDFKKANPYTKS